MVKKKVGGAQRYSTALKSKMKQDASSKPGPAPPAHLQRKISRKIKFMDKVAATASLAAKSNIKKKPRRRPLPDLRSLSGVLSEAAAEAEEHALKKKADKMKMEHSATSNRRREQIAVREMARMQQVMAHDVFKSNPIAAITRHLTTVLPPPPPAPVPARNPDGHGSKVKKNKKKQRKKKGEADGMHE